MEYKDSQSNLNIMRITIIGKDINNLINLIKDNAKINNVSKNLKNIEDFWEINNKTNTNNLSILDQTNFYLKEIKHDKNNSKDILIIKLDNIEEKIIELIYAELNESIDIYFMPIIIFLVQESNSKLNLKFFDYNKNKYTKINQNLIFVKEYDKYINEFGFQNKSPRIKNLLNKSFSIINNLGEEFSIGEGNNIIKYELEPEYDLSLELKYISLCAEAEELYKKNCIIFDEFDFKNGVVYLEQNIDLINKEKERIKQLSDKELFSEVLNKKIKKNNRIIYLKLALLEYKNIYELIKKLDDNDISLDEENIKLILEKLNEEEKAKKKLRNFCEYYLIKILNIEVIIDKIDYDQITNTLKDESDDEIKTGDDIDKDIEIPKEIIEIGNNKDIKELLKDIFPDEKIDFKFLKENLEKNNYKDKLKNLYQVISEIIGDDSNDIFNFEGMIEIFSIDENILNDFKKYYSLIKIEEYKIKVMKERKEEKIKIMEKRKEEKTKKKISQEKLRDVLLKELLNIKLKIIKKIKLSFIKKKYAIEAVESLIILDKKIIIKTDGNLFCYNLETYELIFKMKIDFTNNLLKIKNSILGKVYNKDYCYLIKSNLKRIKIFFPHSSKFNLEFQASNGEILMKNSKKKNIYFYSKLNNNNYSLTKILYHPFNQIYEFIPNYLFISDKYIYIYSLNDLNLIKYKKVKEGFSPQYYKIRENRILYFSAEVIGFKYYGSYYKILDLNSLLTISSVKLYENIQDLLITTDEKILESTNHGLKIIKLLNDREMIENRLYHGFVGDIREISKNKIIFFSNSEKNLFELVVGEI